MGRKRVVRGVGPRVGCACCLAQWREIRYSDGDTDSDRDRRTGGQAGRYIAIHQEKGKDGQREGEKEKEREEGAER